MMETVCFAAGEGVYRVQLTATLTGDGIIVQLLGGQKPHLGAVVFSFPRPGLADPAKTGCNSAVVPRLGHKDDEAARPLAEMIAAATGQPVAVCAGIHVDGATAEDIALLVQNCRQVGERFLAFYRGEKERAAFEAPGERRQGVRGRGPADGG